MYSGEPDEPISFDILTHDRFGHKTPTDSLPQQHVLRTKIGEPPGLRSDHATILAIRKRGSVRQHKLDVVACRARRIVAGARQRMIGGRDRNKFDAADAYGGISRAWGGGVSTRAYA